MTTAPPPIPPSTTFIDEASDHPDYDLPGLGGVVSRKRLETVMNAPLDVAPALAQQGPPPNAVACLNHFEAVRFIQAFMLDHRRWIPMRIGAPLEKRRFGKLVMIYDRADPLADLTSATKWVKEIRHRFDEIVVL